MLLGRSKLTSHRMPPSMIRTLRPVIRNDRHSEACFHELLNMAGLAQ